MCIIDGQTRVNPTQAELASAQATILYAGTATRTVAVEAQAKGAGVANAALAQALRVAHDHVRRPSRLAGPFRRGVSRGEESLHHARVSPPPVAHSPQVSLLLEPQLKLAAAAGAQKRRSRLTVPSPDLLQKGRDLAGAAIREAFRKGAQMDKRARGEEQRFARAQLSTALASKGVVLPNPILGALFDELASAEVRRLALDEGARLDGRGLAELRPVACEAGVIPRVHGSSIFERGETQSLVTVTVGALDEAQRVEDLGVSATKRLMVHYVFPPFSVNETGRAQGLSRREIGHGVLAERALAGMLPGEARGWEGAPFPRTTIFVKQLRPVATMPALLRARPAPPCRPLRAAPQDAFPFCVRVNSETLQSNGSSAMAAVCAGCGRAAGPCSAAPAEGAGCLLAQEPSLPRRAAAQVDGPYGRRRAAAEPRGWRLHRCASGPSPCRAEPSPGQAGSAQPPTRLPLPNPAAGLVMEEDPATGKVTRHALLTDIQGAEDHWGDMDFKVRPSFSALVRPQRSPHTHSRMRPSRRRSAPNPGRGDPRGNHRGAA